MTHKRNRSVKEKIAECLDDKIQNLHPYLREKLFTELQTVPESKNVSNCKKYIVKHLSIPEMGRHTKQYWTSRGWSEGDAYIKSRQCSQKGKISTYSREFWTAKINSNTEKNYTDDEADYERNSRRPIRKEYWMKLGYSDQESERLCLEQKNKNNKAGANAAKSNIEIQKITSKRCVEYWISKGCTEVESKEEVSKQQATFTLKKCIEKYGEEDGKQRWLDRQEKWHKSYKKSNFSKVSQRLFWEICEKLDRLNDIYFAELDDDKNKDLSGRNHEIRLRLDRVVLPDFIDTKQNKIIEFDGTYWHGEVGRGNKDRDENKEDLYKKFGYTVYRVSENDYKINSELVIEKCLNFLTI
jgi:G:T-mismatch repair DNA endonuclease (very short patch repair protein)